jgi:dienelactone hydrolase
MLVLAVAARSSAQAQQPEPGDAVFGVFLSNTQIGREQVTLSKSASGWIITSSGNIGMPVDFVLNRFEMKYAPDWQAQEMKLDARLKNTPMTIATSFTVTSAINDITQAGRGGGKTDQVSARAIVLPNNVFGAYEALAVHLWDATPGTTLRVYVVPQTEIKVDVRSVSDQTLTGPAGALSTRRFELQFENPTGPVAAIAVVDNRRRLVRFELPEIFLAVVREDASSVAVRSQAAHNPTDAEVGIRANGFQLAGTLTTPPAVAGRLRYPGVVLIGGAAPADRDELIDGVPIFTQLAKALADTGHIVLRYDRRGAGQSGGRIDTVTLNDYADDAIAAVKWLAKQDGVDTRHLVAVGYADGGAVALIAAAREKSIDAVVTVDASGSLGADLLLVQQRRVLDDLKLSPTDRQARIDLQKKIQAAVISGKGWEGIPAPLRKQADTPWFRSVLTYNPALVLPQVRQPLLIVHADLDPNVPPSEADLLAEIARTRKKAPPTTVVHVPDVNHTFADARTHATSETFVSALVDWIHKL